MRLTFNWTLPALALALLFLGLTLGGQTPAARGAPPLQATPDPATTA
ncbi:MAG: hypothetical protein HZB20_07710, partial [Chloroflexi bacterium]|nr:hypothetical protein [Chloroflexota bacterium]